MGFTIFLIVVIVLGLAGLAMQKNGELAGLGREGKRGGLRWPHGRLVRTKRLDAFEDVSFASKFVRVAAITFAITIIIGILCIAGLMDFADTLPTSLDLLAVVGVACALTQGDVGVWRSLGYALFGYVAAGVIATLLGLFALPHLVDIGTGGINALTMIFGTLGAAVAVAAMPLVRTYAREFEDGHVNSIQVTSTSAAARAYDRLLDSAWKPPEDRIKDADEAYNPRKAMSKKRPDNLK